MSTDSAYRGCKFCHGRGCLACAGEQERAGPPGPIKPIFVADLDNPHDMMLLEKFLGREAVEKAFSSGGMIPGGGAKEIEFNAAVASLIQTIHRHDVGEGDDDTR